MKKFFERLLPGVRSPRVVPVAATAEPKTLRSQPSVAVQFLGLRLCQVGNMATGDFIEGGQRPAVIAKFRSSADHDLHVGADLLFSDAATGAEIHGPIRGSWLDHHYNYARFDSGQTQDLLIAFEQGGNLLVADDRRAHDSSYGQLEMMPLPAGRVSVSIALVTETVTVEPTRFTFEWTPNRGFVLESM